MPIKDTHTYEKTACGVMAHFWTEEDERLYTQLRLDDEADSVTFVMSARTKGIRGPSVETEAGVRMTYADLEKLMSRGQEILDERVPAERAGTQLPALRIDDGQIRPDEPVVQFERFECRECHEQSEWLRKPDDDSHYEWPFEHHKTTKHSHFYRWSAGRNTLRTGSI